MNEHFVNIKVDREERPDVDAIYMEAVVALTGHGGWPMTVFLTPDGEPFYGGTYFPPEPRHGMPGFPQVLAAIADGLARAARRGRVGGGAARRGDRPLGVASARRKEPLTTALLAEAVRGLRASFDAGERRLRRRAEVPAHAPALEFLLRRAHGDDAARCMVTQTLDKMAAGGMYDQLGGGFHRYSVDERWLVPHFEKMLYDNALLASAYLHALARRPARSATARSSSETLDYLLRELLLAGGRLRLGAGRRHATATRA